MMMSGKDFLKNTSGPGPRYGGALNEYVYSPNWQKQHRKKRKKKHTSDTTPPHGPQ